MVDINDQNQVGPPALSPTTTAATAQSIVAPEVPATNIQPEQLDRVTLLVDTLDQLAQTVGEVTKRNQLIEQGRRASRNESTPIEVARIWHSALEPLAHYLAQPVQLTAGVAPIALDEAVDQLRSWVANYRENAVGPGGQGLQHDESRLANFEAKLTAIDPSPEWLQQEGQRLLARPELEPETIERTATATLQAITDDSERDKAIAASLASLNEEWEVSMMPLADRLSDLSTKLRTLESETKTPLARSRCAEGIKAVESVDLDELIRKRVSLGEWVDKYKTDPAFTATQIQQRINQELRPALRQIQTTIERLEHEFSPERIQNEAAANEQATRQKRVDSVDQLLSQIRNRYQALVALRRAKLGQEPDERFFGELAKQVNSAITRLGNLEAEILTARSELIDGSAPSEISLQALQSRTQTALEQTVRFSDSAHLEEILGKQAELKQAEERKLAQIEAARAAKEKRDEILRKGRELQAEKQRARREEREAKEKQQAHETQTLQARLSEQTSIQQQLIIHLKELESLEQEQQRRAKTLDGIIEQEQQILLKDQQKLLVHQTERRALSADEAEAWLKTLAEEKQSLNERQEHLNQLTHELNGLRGNATATTRIAKLNEQVQKLTPTESIGNATPVTQPSDQETVRIPISGR